MFDQNMLHDILFQLIFDVINNISKKISDICYYRPTDIPIRTIVIIILFNEILIDI